MQKSEKSKKAKKKLNFVLDSKSVVLNLKKIFLPWIIISALFVLIYSGVYMVVHTMIDEVTTTVNFSFDGIEAGLDPSGNKFNVNDMKSKETIEKCIEELDIKDADVNKIYSNITISGLVPTDVIERITNYTSIYNSDEVAVSKNIQDSSYYPTQYKIQIDCYKAELSKKESADLLNLLTEKYKKTFFDSYGYNKSLENAVISVDYNDYDYVDAVTVFSSYLESLQNYVDDLAANDSIRFCSDETGFTFADLSKSIETIRTEDLDMVLSYITLNNITKDKENLIANYKFKIEQLERSKKTYEERLQAVNDTISVYEKNSVLIFGNATDGANATLNQSSETYDKLIVERIMAQTNVASCEQKVNKYNERIDSLSDNSSKSGTSEYVEEKFESINLKIENLLKIVNITATEYYEKVLYENAYEILMPASSSVVYVIKSSANNLIMTIIGCEILFSAVYILIAVILAFTGKEVNLSIIKNRKSKKNSVKKKQGRK